MLRTANDQATLWELILPAELLVLPPEPLGVDALPHDAVFFALFAPYFDARMGRPRGDPSAVLTVLIGPRRQERQHGPLPVTKPAIGG